MNTRRLNPLFFESQIQIPIANKYLGCGHKGLVFYRNKNNERHGQGTHCTKMGADSLAENTPNAPEFISPIGLPKPKSSGFQ